MAAKVEVVYKRENMRGYKTVTFSTQEGAFAFIFNQQPVEVHAIRVTNPDVEKRLEA
tara:strand:- start:362 stop:532 length:171 start_codon:yes stop_codon:yes gene_type:complete